MLISISIDNDTINNMWKFQFHILINNRVMSSPWITFGIFYQSSDSHIALRSLCSSESVEEMQRIMFEDCIVCLLLCWSLGSVKGERLKDWMTKHISWACRDWVFALLLKCKYIRSHISTQCWSILYKHIEFQ